MTAEKCQQNVFQRAGIPPETIIGDVSIDFKAQLGNGAFGTVYKGSWRTPGGIRAVAVKVLHPLLLQLNPDDTFRQVGDECKVLRRLRHDNVVALFGVTLLPDGGLAVVTELMDMTLEQYSQTSRPSFPENLDIFCDVSAGLAHIHSHGIVHRDLTPRNILLTDPPNRRAKIADVGVSRSLHGDPDYHCMTRCPGTMAYMPPEAFVERPRYNERLDSFSFGVTVMSVLLRRAPGQEVMFSPREIILPGGRKQVIPEVERRAESLDEFPIDHPLLELIKQCLHNNPDHRPSAKTINENLQHIRTGLNVPLPRKQEIYRQGDGQPTTASHQAGQNRLDRALVAQEEEQQQRKLFDDMWQQLRSAIADKEQLQQQLTEKTTEIAAQKETVDREVQEKRRLTERLAVEVEEKTKLAERVAQEVVEKERLTAQLRQQTAVVSERTLSQEFQSMATLTDPVGMSDRDRAHYYYARACRVESEMREIYTLFTSKLIDFNVKRLIAYGQEGVVFMATGRHQCLQDKTKEYALKVLFNIFDYKTLSKVRQYYENEYKILATLPFHDNIIRLLAFFYDRMGRNLPGMERFDALPPNRSRTLSLFLVMDYLPLTLETHSKRYRNVGRLTFEVLLDWSRQLAEAANFLTLHNVVHRDMKLNNVLVSSNGLLKVCDFGMAIQTPTEELSIEYFADRSTGGNIAHLAPEVLNVSSLPGGHGPKFVRYKKQCVWELGVLMHEIASGDSPFEDLDQQGYDTAVLPEIAVPRAANNQARSQVAIAELKALVLRMLSFEPDSRPTITHVLTVLTDLAKRFPIK